MRDQDTTNQIPEDAAPAVQWWLDQAVKEANTNLVDAGKPPMTKSEAATFRTEQLQEILDASDKDKDALIEFIQEEYASFKEAGSILGALTSGKPRPGGRSR